AVDILRPVYTKLDDWRSLVTLLGHRFEAAEDSSEKVVLLREVAELWEARGSDLQRALGALERAFELVPEDGEIRAEVERIATQLEAWDGLAELYERVVPNAESLVQLE